MSGYEKAYESGLQAGFEAGKRDFAKEWMRDRDSISPEARLAKMRLEHEHLRLKDRHFCEGVPIAPFDKMEGRVKATREGMLLGLSAGVYLSDKERIPALLDFISGRLAPIVRDGEWFDFGLIPDDVFCNASKGWQSFAEASLIEMPFPRTVFRVQIELREPTPKRDVITLVFVIDQPETGGPFHVCSFFVERGLLGVSLHNFARFDKASLQAFKLAHDARSLGVLSLWMILNTKGVAQRKIEPPAKLNKAREKSGKLPIQPHISVDTQAYVTALRETERMEAEGPGHHASPKPHLRRAHLRHLRSGKIIPIMAMIVNGSAGLKMAQRERYDVRLRPEK